MFHSLCFFISTPPLPSEIQNNSVCFLCYVGIGCYSSTLHGPPKINMIVHCLLPPSQLTSSLCSLVLLLLLSPVRSEPVYQDPACHKAVYRMTSSLFTKFVEFDFEWEQSFLTFSPHCQSLCLRLVSFLPCVLSPEAPV